MVSPIGCNQLCFISDKLTVDFLHLHKKNLYNKMGYVFELHGWKRHFHF
jgi:hypothetical protein